MMNETTISLFDVSVIDLSGIDVQTALIINWIIYTILCQTVEVFGIASNIVNILCFVKLGFKDPINISLLGLAISDLCALVTTIWINISFTPAFMEAHLPFEVLEVFYLVAAMPHATFSRVSSWITALITLERCLCIVVPLKVKTIVTPPRVTVIIICVFIILLCCGAPIYIVNKLDVNFSLWRNRTIFGLVSTADKESVEKMYFALNNFFLQFAAFLIITICTTILVTSLKKRTEWRKTSANITQASISQRNRKAAQMVVMISTLFIACFIPITIVFLAIVFEPALALGGRLVNIGIIAGGFGILLETINSSANIFIYYFMSTKYREIFRSIFCQIKTLETLKQ